MVSTEVSERAGPDRRQKTRIRDRNMTTDLFEVPGTLSQKLTAGRNLRQSSADPSAYGLRRDIEVFWTGSRHAVPTTPTATFCLRPVG